MQKELVDKNHTIFARVAEIIEGARFSVFRTINSQMVIAYWYIGYEIVEEEQQGRERAEYGEKLLENLSEKLTDTFGKGFSATNLRYFRKFYLAYPGRLPIQRRSGAESNITTIFIEKQHLAGAESSNCSPAGNELNPLALLLSYSPQVLCGGRTKNGQACSR